MAEEEKITEIDTENVPAAEEITVEAADNSKTSEVTVEDGIEQLRRRLEEAEVRAREAETRAHQAETVARNASYSVDEANLHVVNSVLDNLRREGDILKANYRAAMAASDFERAADFQEAMSVNANKLFQLENGKQELEAKQKVAPRHADPVEAFAAQLSPRSAEWVRRNPQCVTDPRLHQKMVAAHNLAIADGYTADTDDYFSFVESTLKLNRGRATQQDEPEQTESALSAAAAPKQRRAVAPAAAPVSRESTSRSNVVRLSEQEREMASMMKMTDQEYAKHKLALQKEGKLH
jgi:hypothetical protein